MDGTLPQRWDIMGSVPSETTVTSKIWEHLVRIPEFLDVPHSLYLILEKPGTTVVTLTNNHQVAFHHQSRCPRGHSQPARTDTSHGSSTMSNLGSSGTHQHLRKKEQHTGKNYTETHHSVLGRQSSRRVRPLQTSSDRLAARPCVDISSAQRLISRPDVWY